MTFRFRPTVEALDARALPSAVFANSAESTLSIDQAVQVADTGGASTAGTADQDDSVMAKKKGSKPVPPIKIVLENATVSSYS